MELKEIIIDLMKQNGIANLKILSEKSGVPYSTLNSIVKGNISNIRLNTLTSLSRFFNVSTDFLAGNTSIQNPKKTIEKYLTKLNLSEDEYKESIEHLIKEKEFKFNKNNVKINKVFMFLFSIYNDYLKSNSIYIDIDNLNKSPTFEELKEFKKQNEPIDNLFVELLKSLDKNKILHKYNKIHMCPIYGEISAGQPNWAEENIEGYLPIDPELMGISDFKDCFFLKVNGESMNRVIKNGAYALIHKQDCVENNEIAVVLVDGQEATLKRFSKKDNIIVLTPDSTDETIEQQIYTKNSPVQIIGKYIGKMEFNN